MRLAFSLTLFLTFALRAFFTHAQQVEKVIVETYYISDVNDATDTTGGALPAYSVTYRVYIDLASGCKLRKIYGDANHPLKVASTSAFYNYGNGEGQSFGKDVARTRFKNDPLLALDTWLTLGLATKTNLGVLKSEDADGSLIGGTLNNGGSASIPGGLLVNNEPMAGIPLTSADGLSALTSTPSNWANYGFLDINTGADSTIFGSEKPGTEFISYNAGLQNSGTTGGNEGNKVLVAQLTTQGQISFELNIEVADSAGNITRYVASGKDTIYTSGGTTIREKLFPELKYPPSCGCRDPRYLEYSASFSCDENDKCKTPVVYGCLDTTACNYNSKANFSVPSLCCYPGYCNDRNISVVCPSLLNGQATVPGFAVYPNPVQRLLTFPVSVSYDTEVSYAVYNTFGRAVFEKNMGVFSGTVTEQADISSLEPGIYMLRVFVGNTSFSKTFLKN